MSRRTDALIQLPPRLVRTVRSLAARESRSVTAVLSAAVRAYADQQEEAAFRRAIRAAARKKGLTSQEAVARTVDAFRTAR